jgi:LPXTG-motif cell wall-anchored protein
MKTLFATIASLVAGAGIGSLAARAHESVVPHAHPHLHTVDGALPGYDTLALIALGLIAVTGGSLLLARRRRK